MFSSIDEWTIPFLVEEWPGFKLIFDRVAVNENQQA
jgi:hypothetical protein